MGWRGALLGQAQETKRSPKGRAAGLLCDTGAAAVTDTEEERVGLDQQGNRGQKQTGSSARWDQQARPFICLK